MDDRHFRAVIRTALRAGGFDPPMAEVLAAERRATALGQQLRNLLIERLPAFAAQADIADLADEDSFVWGRLPSMLAFGHQQAVVFRRLIHPERRSLPAAALLPVAAFSAGISLLDYLADALGMAEPIFEVLDEATVAGLFAAGGAEARLRHAYEQAADRRLRLLLALVAMCGDGIRALHRRHGDDQGRDDLLATFARLHVAQKTVTFHHASPSPGPAATDVVAAKSVLPFVAAYQIAELFDPPGAAKRSGRELARQIGEAVALADDLVDLQSDWRSRSPNTLIGAASGCGPGGGPADSWLYGVAGQTAAQIADTLRAAALLYPSQRPAPARMTAIEAAAKFATFTVARWVGWREEVSSPSVFSSRRPRSRPAMPGSCADAANVLLAQQRTGYREATHWMTVPRIDGDRVRLETHPAITFQRAVVLDSLLDAYAAGLEVPATVLAHEALQVLQAKRNDVRGGWSYLPGVPELPPDADDLAMVLQALSRCGGQPLAAACDDALDVVLSSADHGGGGVPTWILDPGDAPDRNELFRRYIELTQADGIHPDVVANLLYAVGLQATGIHGERAASAITYLESAQDDDGSWRSRWYWGKHYGTFRTVLALTALAPGSPALVRARDYLVSGQNADGGWGGDASDPLSTAFAALSLAALAHPGARRRLRPALEYLLATQQADGSWPGCPFIAFPRVGGAGVHIYSSATITTSFCLKAVLAARAGGRAASPQVRRAAVAHQPRPDWPTGADWS